MTYFNNLEDSINQDDIWENDVFDREREAELLTRMLSTINDGFVLNIDAPWGYGKTYFLQRWKISIEKKHPCVYFNAWESDYSNDPFPVFLAAISNGLQQYYPDSDLHVKNTLFEKGKKIICKSKSMIFKAVARKALGENGVEEINDLIDGKTEDELIGLVGDELKRTMDEYELRNIAISEFKDSISEIINKIEKCSWPLFVFVDELDRCRPTFAIKFLESLKHIFVTKKVVFIVATDTSQLQESICSIYGAGFDGKTYLRRFFDQTYRLKCPSLHKFVSGLFLKCTPKINGYSVYFIKDSLEETFSWLALMFNISLRDIEQIFNRYCAILNVNNSIKNIHVDYLVLLLIAQIKLDSILYTNFINGKIKPEEFWTVLKDNVVSEHGMSEYIRSLDSYFSSENDSSLYISEKASDIERRMRNNPGSNDNYTRYCYSIYMQIQSDFTGYANHRYLVEFGGNFS